MVRPRRTSDPPIDPTDPILADLARPRLNPRGNTSQPDPMIMALTEMQQNMAAARQRELEVMMKANQDLLEANRLANQEMMAASRMANIEMMRLLLVEVREGGQGPQPQPLQQPQPEPQPQQPVPPPHNPIVVEGEGNNDVNEESSHRGGVAQPATNREQRERMLNAFRKHAPPNYKGGIDPIAAIQWLEELDRIFTVMECDDQQKLLYASYMLQNDAADWWRNTRLPLECQGYAITWPLFERQFLLKYFPAEARIRKKGEFEELKQGQMSIDEYLNKFNKLAKYSHFQRAPPTEDDLILYETSSLNSTSHVRSLSSLLPYPFRSINFLFVRNVKPPLHLPDL